VAVAFRSVSVATSGTPGHPTGHTQDDIYVAIASNESGSTAPTPPSGWTTINTDGNAGNSGVLSHCTAWIRHGASDPAMAWTNADHVTVMCYSGCKTTDSPINISSYGEGNGTVTYATITTTVDNCMIVGLHNVWTWAAETPGSFANERSDQGANGPNHTFDDGLLVTAGATGSLTTGGSDIFGATLVALEPPAAGGGSTNAAAENSAATGAAQNATPSTAPNAGNASATGVAEAPAAVVAPNGGNAAATGAAQAVASSVATTGGNASATGQALDATVSTGAFTNVDAGLASAAGDAMVVAVEVKPSGGLSSATGAALNATIAIGASAGLSSATTTAFAPSTSMAPTGGLASATATALAPSSAVLVLAGVAAVTGAANQPTITAGASIPDENPIILEFTEPGAMTRREPGSATFQESGSVTHRETGPVAHQESAALRYRERP
jgi:hypothetical protein